MSEATIAIKACAIATGRYQTKRDPARLFVDILQTALTQKSVYLCDRESGRKPDNPQWWGYELNEYEGTCHPSVKAEKLGWVDHNGEAKMIAPGDPGNIGMASPGVISVETLTQLYDNFVNHADPRTITLSGEEVKGITGGVLRPRPLEITGLYPIGRESNRLLDEADDLLEPATLFQLDAKTTTAPAPVSPARHISSISGEAIERLKPYPGDLVAKAIGVSPRTWDNYKNSIRTPPILIARKLSALVTSLPTPPPSNRAEQIRLLNEFIKLQSAGLPAAARPDLSIPPRSGETERSEETKPIVALVLGDSHRNALPERTHRERKPTRE